MSDGRRTILVVDDEESLLLATQAILLRGGYSPIAASCAAEALERSHDFKGDIDLLLTDVHMPDMDGITLAEEIAAERPCIRVLMMSGCAGAWNSPLPLLRKPFRLAELLETVAQVIDDPLTFSPERPVESLLGCDDVYSSLTQDLEIARRSYLESSRQWLQEAREVFYGIPSPDSDTLMELQSIPRKQAFMEYQRARMRLGKYIATQKNRRARS